MDFKRNEDILRCHPAIIKLTLDLAFILIPLALLQVGLVFFGHKLLLQDSSLFQFVSWAYRLACLCVGLEMVRRYFNQVLILGHKRVLHLNGILSWRATKVSLRYADIREIHVTQSIAGRIFCYGDISIGTAASGEYEIVLFGFSNPQKIGQILDEMRKGSDLDQHPEEQQAFSEELDRPKVIVPVYRADSINDGKPTHSID